MEAGDGGGDALLTATAALLAEAASGGWGLLRYTMLSPSLKRSRAQVLPMAAGRRATADAVATEARYVRGR